MNQPRIAVLLPCYNEEMTVGAVVQGFRDALGPEAEIYVYDNRSEDRTGAVARAAGAVVRRVEKRGKGHVVRRMFADIDADLYLMADGDLTYAAASAPALIARLLDGQFDMVVGRRVSVPETPSARPAYRPGHRSGNHLITQAVNLLFGYDCSDVLSGYRVFSRRFVKSFPASATGFEIETELTVHALDLGLPCAELPTPYVPRPDGSQSKLHSLRDGYRILAMIMRLLQLNRPLLFFGTIFFLLAAGAILLALPLAITYYETGLVPRFPTAILATGTMLLGFISLACGLILDVVGKGRREAKLLAYLAQPAPAYPPGSAG